MVKKKESLLVLGIYSLIIAFILEMFGGTQVFLDIIILIFVGIAVFSNARYLVLLTLDKKK
ncbi:MAG: hypothetical protein ACFFKA_16895 [Candidatus Thorarchaeota archaeon]